VYVRCFIFFFFLSLTALIVQVEDRRPVYLLPRLTSKRQKIYPGVKDLPPHIRAGFRNMFIRTIIRDVFNSEQPWINPDLVSLQLAYDGIYPTYPARLRCNDAVFHPVNSHSHDI
jgi:hypothetical protein